MSFYSSIPDPSVQPVDWKTIDDAIFDFVRQSQDLSMEAIWEQQNVPQPPYPYISMLRHGDVDEGGLNELRYISLDANQQPVLPGSPEDAEFHDQIIYQPIQFAVTFQAHVDFEAGATDPSCDARAILSRLKRSLSLTASKQLLCDAGLALVRTEATQNLSLVINGEFISRAAVDVFFRTASVMTDRVGFIDKVELKSDDLGVDTVVDSTV